MFAILMILLGCLCIGLLIPVAVLGHYAGLRVVLVSAIALAAALVLAAAGGAAGWLLFTLNDIPPESITAGVIIGFLTGLALGAIGVLRLTKRRRDEFDL